MNDFTRTVYIEIFVCIILISIHKLTRFECLVFILLDLVLQLILIHKVYLKSIKSITTSLDLSND